MDWLEYVNRSNSGDDSSVIPRRCQSDQLRPAERAIQTALWAVQAMGRDERLTDAAVSLQCAFERVADYVDGVPAEEEG